MDADTAPIVLIVDDEWMSRELLRTFLQRGGYHVVEASSGKQALEMVNTHAPALVLLDIRMFDINGFEVCEQIKRNPATREVKVAMLSALSGDAERERAVQVGADDFISKSVNWAAIVERVGQLIGVP